MNDKLAAIIFGVYIFVVLVFLGRVFFREEDSLKQRLARIQAMGSMDEILLQDEKKRRRSVRQPEWFRVSKRMQEDLDGAGVYLSAAEYLGIWLAAATVLPIGSYLTTSNIVVAMMFLAIGLLAPPMTVRILRKKRLDQFSNQLGDALMIMGNCLRSGFSVQQSIERIVTDMPEPISEEFRLATWRWITALPWMKFWHPWRCVWKIRILHWLQPQSAFSRKREVISRRSSTMWRRPYGTESISVRP